MKVTLNHRFHPGNNDDLKKQLTTLGRKILAALDDLKAAVEASNTQTATDLDALNVALSAEMSRITAALAAMPNQDQAIADVTAQVQTMQMTMHAGLSAAVDSLNSEVPDVPPAP